jgi:hypothetical protein
MIVVSLNIFQSLLIKHVSKSVQIVTERSVNFPFCSLLLTCWTQPLLISPLPENSDCGPSTHRIDDQCHIIWKT